MEIIVLKDYEIKQLFRSKFKFRLHPFMVFYKISTGKSGYSGYAITISRNLTKKATERNLIKRQMRTLILKNFISKTKITITFLVLKGYFKFDYSELQTKIINIFDKIRIQRSKI